MHPSKSLHYEIVVFMVNTRGKINERRCSGMFMGDMQVLDTSALISWPLSELDGSMIVSSQIDELHRHSPTRGEIIDSLGVIISEPGKESLSMVSKLAIKTGDMAGLSETDLNLVALAQEKNVVLVTDDYRMQNLAEALGLKWKSAELGGISEIWEWILKCTGCGTTFESPEGPLQKRGELGVCVDCGSPLKLRKK
tara:strand:+ start:642 stop:1229 length:588 start_codon:yes stop_codon:yes gene_type:complete